MLTVTDCYTAGAGVMEGRLFRRRTLFRSDDHDATRCAAARAALDGCAFARPAVLPQYEVNRRAESDEVIVAGSATSPVQRRATGGYAASYTAICPPDRGRGALRLGGRCAAAADREEAALVAKAGTRVR